MGLKNIIAAIRPCKLNNKIRKIKDFYGSIPECIVLINAPGEWSRNFPPDEGGGDKCVKGNTSLTTLQFKIPGECLTSWQNS
jgi:hypothetical protein